MKNLIYLLFSILVLFNLSCLPDKCCTIPRPPANMTAEINGAHWNTSDVKSSLTNLTLNVTAQTIDTDIPSYPRLDSLNFTITYTGLKSYKLAGNQAFYATFTNKTTKTFKLDPNYNNVLNITGYETQQNPVKITGTFDLKFIDPDNAAGISFTNGSFYALISQ